jgi:hypothetical protein
MIAPNTQRMTLSLTSILFAVSPVDASRQEAEVVVGWLRMRADMVNAVKLRWRQLGANLGVLQQSFHGAENHHSMGHSYTS